VDSYRRIFANVDLATRTADVSDMDAPDPFNLDQGNSYLLDMVMLWLALCAKISITRSPVRDDVWKWLGWMKDGGQKPKRLNRRSGGVTSLAQDKLCELLEPYYELLNLADPEYYALLERVTRPLPGTVPLGPPPQWLRA